MFKLPIFIPFLTFFKITIEGITITIIFYLVGGFNYLEKYEFVNGKDDIPYMEHKKNMFETTNQLCISSISIPQPDFCQIFPESNDPASDTDTVPEDGDIAKHSMVRNCITTSKKARFLTCDLYKNIGFGISSYFEVR